MKHALLLSAMLLGCTSTAPSPETTPTGASTATSETHPEPAESGCRAHDSCGPCIAAGCSWTANMCEDDCLMDTWCYGAGNQAAPECPDSPPENTSNW